MTKTIKANVNRRLLTKASRLFTGSLEGRITEVLQNARRAGATRVTIVNKDGMVRVSDNGKGIQDFAKLLDLGGSGWEESLESSEDPAGVGLFCLSPRELTIRSNGRKSTIHPGGWTGKPVEVEKDAKPNKGTELIFQDDPWKVEVVKPLAVFSGLAVKVEGERCPSEPFITGNSIHDEELGAKIQVLSLEKLGEWHKQVAKVGAFGEGNVVVNFHGQIVGFNYRPVDGQKLYFLVGLTGEPTGIRLMLPARTQLVENDAFEQLKQVLEREAYLFLQRQGSHRLPFKQFLRAKELGIELPEAQPRFQIGLLTADMGPEPIEVAMPKDFPLAKCYRLAEALDDGVSDVNVHLLAALGQFNAEEALVPVVIPSGYDGYSWSKLPTIDRVEVKLGKKRQKADVGSGTLTCVESIVIAAFTSDGKVFRSNTVMAVKQPNEEEPCPWFILSDVYVTADATKRLSDDDIWYHLGGYNDEGDSYETQEWNMMQELEGFFALLHGPDEPLRLKIMDTMERLEANWRSVTILPSGKVTINFQDGTKKVLTPP